MRNDMPFIAHCIETNNLFRKSFGNMEYLLKPSIIMSII